jgi:hypothetical protein
MHLPNRELQTGRMPRNESTPGQQPFTLESEPLRLAIRVASEGLNATTIGPHALRACDWGQIVLTRNMTRPRESHELECHRSCRGV